MKIEGRDPRITWLTRGQADLLARDALAALDRGWTKGASGRDDDGNPVHPLDADKVDLFGALWGGVCHLAGTNQRFLFELLDTIRGELLMETGRGLRNPWNDDPGRTLDEVREMVVKITDRIAI